MVSHWLDTLEANKMVRLGHDLFCCEVCLDLVSFKSLHNIQRVAESKCGCKKVARS